MQKEKIVLTDNIYDVMWKMSEGNPGALNVCCMALKYGAEIDPDDAFQGMGPIFRLDSLGIYSSRIWLLYKDVCKQNLAHFCGVLRGNQLGYVTDYEIRNAISEPPMATLDVDSIIAKVTERLPAFNANWEFPSD